MEFVEGAVEDGREQKGDDGDEDEAAKERVDSREDFPAVSIEISQRPHAGENHGGIREGIRPGHLFKKMIANHPNNQSDGGDTRADKSATAHTADERFARQ